MLQKKFFLNNGTSALTYLKELNIVLYYKSYVRCDLLDNVFVLDDGYLLSHIKLGKFSKKAVGSSFLSTRVIYRHKNVPSFRLTSFLSHYVLSAKNAATLIVNNLKIFTHRDENFGFKLFFLLSAVRGGFRCYSTGFRGFMPSSHYKPAMRHFILDVLKKTYYLSLTFYFVKGFLFLFLAHDRALPISHSKYAFYSSYSFFRLAFLMSTSSMGCTRRFKNFAGSKVRQGLRFNLNSVFLNHDFAYKRLEKKICLSESFLRFSFSELRKKRFGIFKDLILRRTKHEKIKGLIYEDKNILSKFSVVDYFPLKNEKKLETVVFTPFGFWVIYQVIKKDFENLKKKIVVLPPPKTELTVRTPKFLGKIRTSFFNAFFVNRNRQLTSLSFRLTEKMKQASNRCNIALFALEYFSFNLLKKLLKIKYKKTNVKKR